MVQLPSFVGLGIAAGEAHALYNSLGVTAQCSVCACCICLTRDISKGSWCRMKTASQPLLTSRYLCCASRTCKRKTLNAITLMLHTANSAKVARSWCSRHLLMVIEYGHFGVAVRNVSK